MTLEGLRTGFKLIKEKHSKVFKDDLFISANKTISVLDKHDEDAREIGLPSNIKISFANISGDIALSNLNDEKDWDTKGIIHGITLNPEYFNVLDKDEIRIMLWHEYGHMVYAYYFPDNFKKGVSLSKSGRKYRKVEEMFVDLFMYNKFGDAYSKALEKCIRYMGGKKGKSQSEIDKSIDKNITSVEKRFKSNPKYWKEYAKSLDVSIDYGPNDSMIKNSNFDKSILDGLY